MYFVYFLRSQKNQKIYCGITEKSPKERLKEHNQGVNEWSRNNRPLILVYFEAYHCKRDAEERERFYKSGVGRRIRNGILNAVSARGGPAFGGG